MKAKLVPQLYSATNHEQKARKAGFEIEFFGISIASTAKILQNLFGGVINEKHKNLTELSDTELGSFTIELDAVLLKRLSRKSLQKQNEGNLDWEGVFETLISSTLKGIIPLEINTPPVLIKDINRLDNIVEKLRETDAYDTKKSLLTAFGVHINPDIPSENVQTILSFMQSFVLLNGWIKSAMPLDLSRKLSGFVKDYPKPYCQKILNEAYKPTLSELIKDYIIDNPSRNRALDMLPLFAYLKGGNIIEKYNIEKLNPRPTFHYRLANSYFSKKGWNFSTEWQRWLYVESLAKQDELRQAMINECLSVKNSEWVKKIEDYIK